MTIDESRIYDAISYPNIYPHADTEDIPNETYTKELFNMFALNRTLLDRLISDYNGLYNTQETAFGINKYQIKLSELKPFVTKLNGYGTYGYPKKYIFYIECSFVHQSSMKLFKSSSLYGVPMSQHTISNNSKIFHKNFLVFLNGNILNGCELVVDDCKMGLIVNIGSRVSTEYITVDMIKSLADNDGYLTLLLVPNYKVSTLSMPTALTNIEEFNVKMNSLITNGTIACYNNANKIISQFIKIPENSSVIDIFSDKLDPATTDTLFKLTEYTDVHFINFINKPTMISTSNKYFNLTNFKMPIPVSNIMIFGHNGDSYTFCENESTELFYPNIYKISSDMDTYDVYIFYMDFYGSNEKYNNDIDLYSDNISDIISDYENDTVPDIVKSYQPMNFKYSIPNYEKENPDSSSILSYKLNKLNDIFNDNYQNIVRYMEYVIPDNRVYINTDNINLNDMERTNTSIETPNIDIEFSSPMIVISIIGSSMISGFRVFIDGRILSMNNICITKSNNTYYIYISKSYINSGSIIEIEKYYGYDQHSNINITKTNDTIEFDKPNVTVYKSDIYAINTETKEIIDDSNYEVYLNVDDIGYVKVTDDFRILSNNFKVVYTGDISDEIISIIVRKKTLRNIEYISGYDTSSYTIASMMNHDNPKPSNYRLFRNNRLIDISKYAVINKSAYTNDMDKFILSFRNNNNDSIIIDKTSDYRHLVYSQSEISDNGFVEITSEIIFPINLRWYEIYLNGLKLTPYNIDIVSNNSFYIKNVSTKKDLQIYLINLSQVESFIPKINPSLDIHNKLMSNEYIKSIVDLKYSDISETMDNVIPNDIVLSEDDIIYANLYKDYLCSYYINANIPQITDDIKEQYPDMIDDDGILYLSTVPKSESDILFMLNGNITLKE